MKVQFRRRYASGCATLCIALLAAFSCVGSTSAAAPEEPGKKYVMSFDRHSTVGRRYRVIASYKHMLTMRFAEPAMREPRERLIVAKCEGIRTALAVGADGKASKISLVVEELTYRVNDGPEQSIPRGTTFTSEMKDGKLALAMDGREVPEGVRTFLEELIFPVSGSISADERFGTKAARAVGEEWLINAAATAAAFSAGDVNADAKDIAGTVKLAGLREVDKIQCFQTESNYRVANLTQKVAEAAHPDAMSEFSERATIMLPVKESGTRVRFSTVNEWTTRYTWKPKDGPAIPVVETSRVELDERSTPMDEPK